jgi:hypothetical protein
MDQSGRAGSGGRTIRRIWLTYATVAGVIVLIIAGATLLRFGRFEWIAHPAPISVWNNGPEPLHVQVTGTTGSASYTVPAMGLVNLGIPASVGEATAVTGDDCLIGSGGAGFGSLLEGALLEFGTVRCGGLGEGVLYLEFLQPDRGS